MGYNENKDSDGVDRTYSDYNKIVAYSTFTLNDRGTYSVKTSAQQNSKTSRMTQIILSAVNFAKIQLQSISVDAIPQQACRANRQQPQ